jgi:hypothetical protein
MIQASYTGAKSASLKVSALSAWGRSAYELSIFIILRFLAQIIPFELGTKGFLGFGAMPTIFHASSKA